MLYTSADDWRAAPRKKVLFFGMSGLGKTHVSNILRGGGDWFHYSIDYRIGTRYMGEYITDNAKAEAMKVPFLRDLLLSDSEARNLRRYLLNGGFLMFDDFWGEADYRVVANELKKVLPEFEPREIPLAHPIFQQVFQLKEKPQIPNVRTGTLSQYTGVTWETEDSKVPHYRGIFDDKGRLMVCICHNTDLGDGWEREGHEVEYFLRFSEKWSYPFGINAITYALTH